MDEKSRLRQERQHRPNMILTWAKAFTQTEMSVLVICDMTYPTEVAASVELNSFIEGDGGLALSE